MNSIQKDIFSSNYISSSNPYQMPFAIPILQTLYTKAYSLNIEEIYSLFSNKHKEIVRDTIANLEKHTLIKVITSLNSKSEQRYEITDSGKTFLFEFYMRGL